MSPRKRSGSPGKRAGLAVLSVALLAGCVSVPSGPSMMVLPGAGMGFDQFRADDMECRQFAAYQGGGDAQAAASNAGVQSAVVGTAVGALAGAAIGGHRGAGVGAGTGLLVGAMAGSGTASVSGREAQRRYDIAYGQCMYAKGHRVPVPGHFAAPERPAPAAFPPPGTPAPGSAAPGAPSPAYPPLPPERR